MDQANNELIKNATTNKEKLIMSENKVKDIEKKCQTLFENLNESIKLVNSLTQQNQNLVKQIQMSDQIIKSSQNKAEYFKKRTEQLMNEDDNTKFFNASTDAVVKYFLKNYI